MCAQTAVAAHPRIAKTPGDTGVRPNLTDYAALRSCFDWSMARQGLSGLPHGGGLNIAYEAVGRHASGPAGGRAALRWIGRDGKRRDFTYAGLDAAASRFANVLGALGLAAGDVVVLLLGRVPELYVAMLGALKAKVVVSPLFSAFGPEPIATRIEMAQARLLVTTEALYRRKVDQVRPRLTSLRNVVLIDGKDELPGTLRW